MPQGVIAIAALAVAAVGTGVSIYEGEKSSKLAAQANQQQLQATDLQRKMNDLAAARQKRDSIRQARIAAAQAEQTGENQGSAASSSAIGGQGSIVSQLNSNLSFLDQYNYMSDQASVKLGNASSLETAANAARSTGAAAGEISTLGMNVFANSPKISTALNGVFHPGAK